MEWKIIVGAVPGLVKILLICVIGAAIGYYMRMLSSRISFGNYFVDNCAVCIVSTIPSLFSVFILYEITGIQKLRESIRGLMRKKSST